MIRIYRIPMAQSIHKTQQILERLGRALLKRLQCLRVFRAAHYGWGTMPRMSRMYGWKFCLAALGFNGINNKSLLQDVSFRLGSGERVLFFFSFFFFFFLLLSSFLCDFGLFRRLHGDEIACSCRCSKHRRRHNLLAHPFTFRMCVCRFELDFRRPLQICVYSSINSFKMQAYTDTHTRTCSYLP